VDAALHAGDGDVVDGAEDELPGVADGGGLGKVGDLSVGDFGGVGKLIGKCAEAGAQDESDFGAQGGLRKNELSGFFGAIVFGGGSNIFQESAGREAGIEAD
jgi:hypothetical protein